MQKTNKNWLFHKWINNRKLLILLLQYIYLHQFEYLHFLLVFLMCVCCCCCCRLHIMLKNIHINIFAAPQHRTTHQNINYLHILHMLADRFLFNLMFYVYFFFFFQFFVIIIRNTKKGKKYNIINIFLFYITLPFLNSDEHRATVDRTIYMSLCNKNMNIW